MKGSSLVDVCITISPFQESAEQAIRSVLRNQELVACVHICSKRQFENDLLAQVKCPIEWHTDGGDIDESRIRSQVLIRIPPDVQVLPAAFHTLLQRIEKRTKAKRNFGMSSITVIESDKLSLGQFSYGFLVVLLIFDWLRYAFTFGQYPRGCDVTAHLVGIDFPNKRSLSHVPRFATWCGTQTDRIVYDDTACQQIPSEQDQGLKFVVRTIKTHPYLGIGMWMLFFAIYYLVFSLPWWNVLVGRDGWFYRDLWGNPMWFTLYGLHTGFLFFLVGRHMSFPNGQLHFGCLFYVLYLTFFPLIYVISRFFVVSQAGRGSVKN